MEAFTLQLRDFLQTGQFGPLKSGMTLLDVSEILGEPEDWHVSRKIITKARSIVWKYGLLQIGFSEDDTVSWILLQPRHDEIHLPKGIHVVGYFPTVTTDVMEFENYLKSEELDYHITVLDAEDTRIIVASKVSAAFGASGHMDEMITPFRAGELYYLEHRKR